MSIKKNTANTCKILYDKPALVCYQVKAIDKNAAKTIVNIYIIKYNELHIELQHIFDY